jgi:hypothetical protein
LPPAVLEKSGLAKGILVANQNKNTPGVIWHHHSFSFLFSPSKRRPGNNQLLRLWQLMGVSLVFKSRSTKGRPMNRNLSIALTVVLAFAPGIAYAYSQGGTNSEQQHSLLSNLRIPYCPPQ